MSIIEKMLNCDQNQVKNAGRPGKQAAESAGDYGSHFRCDSGAGRSAGENGGTNGLSAYDEQPKKEAI